jgi:hypothetical protein
MPMRLNLTHLLFLICFLVPGPVMRSQNFQGRLILGINGSQIDGDGMSGYYKPGLVTGLAARFPVSSSVSLGPEIMYSQKGSKASFEQVTEQGFPRIIYRLNYLDMALVADYRLSQQRACIEGGLSAGYRLNAKLDNGTNLGFVDNTDLFKPVDFQLVFGLKYEIFDNCWFGGRALYSVVSTNAQGLTNFNYGLVGGPGRGGFFNNLLQFSLTMRVFGPRDAKEKAQAGDSVPLRTTTRVRCTAGAPAASPDPTLAGPAATAGT